MKKSFKHNIFKNFLLTGMILCLCFLLCLVMQFTHTDSTLIPAIFVLGVFVTSVLTQGYLYGILAALISVLAVNFAFTFPFFAFNFTMPENLLSAGILLVVSVVTCGLTTKIKYQETIKAEGEKERMRANLLRAVSHDFRTPLTTIYGSSSALLENYEDFSEAQKKRMLQGIQEDSQWLSRMMENLLSITRLDGTNVKLIKTPTVLDELIDSILITFAKRYPDCEVTVSIPETFVTIPMDALLIEQVVMNLLENAVLHATGMTELSLRVSAIGGKAVFEIKDNGCGIPKDKMKDIFTGCYTTDDIPTDGKKAGTGIGLSVCASIIKAHGGTIKAENLKAGGCAFRFALDMEDFENA